MAQRASSQRGLLPCACGSLTERIGHLGLQRLSVEEVWLVGEHRSTGERKYYLSNPPSDTPPKRLAGAIKARWLCELAHQQLKEELGLDYFEGRSWHGLHRHALMSMTAFAFPQARRLGAEGRKKCPSPPPQPTLPSHQVNHFYPAQPTFAANMPSLS